MDRRDPLLMMDLFRVVLELTEGEGAARGQSPTSRHHPFKVTATPDAFPIMLLLFFLEKEMVSSVNHRHWSFISFAGILNKFIRRFGLVDFKEAVFERFNILSTKNVQSRGIFVNLQFQLLPEPPSAALFLNDQNFFAGL